MSWVSILRDALKKTLTISFYHKNFLQNLYKIIFFLTSFLGHFCWSIIKIFLPSNRCEHSFIIITVASGKKEKIGLKQNKLTEIYNNADEFEILFNYSIYLQKSIVFKKFT